MGRRSKGGGDLARPPTCQRLALPRDSGGNELHVHRIPMGREWILVHLSVGESGDRSNTAGMYSSSVLRRF